MQLLDFKNVGGSTFVGMWWVHDVGWGRITADTPAGSFSSPSINKYPLLAAKHAGIVRYTYA